MTEELKKVIELKERVAIIHQAYNMFGNLERIKELLDELENLLKKNGKYV